MTKPTVKLTGEDGNIYNVISIVTRGLKRDGQSEKAKEFKKKALNIKSYDEVLQLVFDYVEVE